MLKPTEKTLTLRPVVMGEVLWDLLPEDVKILGGSCFNVAWQLKAMGLDPLFISRVGNDTLGKEIVDAMESWGLDTSGIQIDDRHPTGAVEIWFENGQPKYRSQPDRAFDFIDATLALSAIEDHALLYQGTYSSRSEVSRDSIEKVCAEKELVRFVDVNLRSPWWNHDLLCGIIRNAGYVKMNIEEVELLLKSDKLSSSGNDLESLKLNSEFGMGACLVTAGDEASHWLESDQVKISCNPPLAENVVDFVGAGDAFSAAIIFGIFQEWSQETILERACHLGALTCGIQGAITKDADHYQSWCRQW